MVQIDFKESKEQVWQQVTEGVERTFLRSKPGGNKIPIKIGAARLIPNILILTPDEVFVIDGI